MEVKLLRILDRGTEISAMAIKMEPDTMPELEILERAGYRPDPACIFLSMIATPSNSTYSSGEWFGAARTMPEAHKYIEDNWSTIETGDTIDVRMLLGEGIND